MMVSLFVLFQIGIGWLSQAESPGIVPVISDHKETKLPHAASLINMCEKQEAIKKAIAKVKSKYPGITRKDLNSCLIAEHAFHVNAFDNIVDNSTRLFRIIGENGGKIPRAVVREILDQQDPSLGFSQIKISTAQEVFSEIHPQFKKAPTENAKEFETRKNFRIIQDLLSEDKPFVYMAHILGNQQARYNRSYIDAFNQQFPRTRMPANASPLNGTGHLCTIYEIGKPEKFAEASGRKGRKPASNEYGQYAERAGKILNWLEDEKSNCALPPVFEKPAPAKLAPGFFCDGKWGKVQVIRQLSRSARAGQLKASEQKLELGGQEGSADAPITLAVGKGMVGIQQADPKSFKKWEPYIEIRKGKVQLTSYKNMPIMLKSRYLDLAQKILPGLPMEEFKMFESMGKCCSQDGEARKSCQRKINIALRTNFLKRDQRAGITGPAIK